MLTPAQAETLIEQHLTCLPIESLPLTQTAGAVLRENIYAERDHPPFDRVAMDGIALSTAAASSNAGRLRVSGTQAAGDPPQTLADGDSCIEIMTGAMLPIGCDAVVPVEQVQRNGDFAEIGRKLVQPWQNVHRRGTDCRQGSLLLSAGTRLSAPEVAIAAGAGMARLRVSAQPMIVVISTGNELVEPGELIEPHQVRRSNAYGITASLRQHGFARVADDHLRDDEAELTERLGFHLRTHDVLILSGGVSMGKLDLVPKVLEKLGVTLVFHHVAQRPGKPMWFGVSQTGPAVFALPGNPVSTLVCLSRYVLPALRTAMGQAPAEPPRIALTTPVEVKAPLAFYVPVKLKSDDWGRTSAEPCLTNGSGDFTALAGTDGFIELPPGPNTFPEGIRGALLSLVTRAGNTMTTTDKIIPLATLGQGRPPVDALHRPIHDLRISVMDRCNFRCPYCMPRETFHESYRFLKSNERLDFAELQRLARVFVRAGVKKLRITGGEPLLRPNLADLIGDLTSLPGIEDVALTTNGMLLAKYATELKAAGLNRITVSLDTLDPDIFAKMSGGFGGVAEVLDGIEHARRAGLAPIKINTVVQRGVNDHTALDLLAHFRGTGVIVRFIEYMDVGTRNHWNPALVVPSRELAARIHARWPIAPREREYRGEVAERHAYVDGAGEIGFISSVSQPFCGDCSRARISSDGSFYTCLFATQGVDLRGPLRAGATDDELFELIRGIWSGRRDRYSELRASMRGSAGLHKIEMNYIGG